jgi:hypothetical protein
MFGHACDEPIALIATHPRDSLVLVCTSKCNMTLLDLTKNRSLRSFSIQSQYFSKEIQQALKVPPLALYFIDSITCRTIQNVLRSTIQNIPFENCFCIVFPKGIVTFDHSYLNCHYKPLDFVATCAAQAPDSIILSDAQGNIYILNLITFTSKKIYTTSSPPLKLFVASFPGEIYGIIAPTQNSIEFIKGSGSLSSSLQCEMGRTLTYDPYTQTLTCAFDKRSAKMFSVTPQKIECIGECSFTGVSLSESKPTNFNVQQVAPCHLASSPHPLFYALCENSALFICGRMQPLMRIDSFPGPRIKKLNGSIMESSLTDMSQLQIVSENMLLIVDISAYFPMICPTQPLPKFYRQLAHPDGIFTTYRKSDLTCIVDRCAKRYYVYDKARKEIAQGEAFDAIIGPENQFAYLTSSQGKKSSVNKLYIVDEKLEKHELAITPNPELPNVQRLLSFGDYLAVVVSANPTDIGINPQSQPRSGALAWRWSTFEPVTLQIEGTSQTVYRNGILVAASPSTYAVYSTKSGELKEICRRNISVIHMKLSNEKLYVLSNDGLYIDDFKNVTFAATKYSHLITHDKSSTRIPINVQYISHIDEKTIAFVDKAGVTTTIGLPVSIDETGGKSMLSNLVSQPDPINAFKQAFANSKEEDKRSILIFMLRIVDWENIEPYLLPAERAATDTVLQSHSQENIDAFKKFLVSEMEIDV